MTPQSSFMVVAPIDPKRAAGLRDRRFPLSMRVWSSGQVLAGASPFVG